MRGLLLCVVLLGCGEPVTAVDYGGPYTLAMTGLVDGSYPATIPADDGTPITVDVVAPDFTTSGAADWRVMPTGFRIDDWTIRSEYSSGAYVALSFAGCDMSAVAGEFSCRTTMRISSNTMPARDGAVRLVFRR